MWHRSLRRAPALVGVVALLAPAGPAEAGGQPPVAAATAPAPPSSTAAAPARAAALTATVWTGGDRLRMRHNASTELRIAGRLAHGVRLSVRCQLAGEHIAGTVRRTELWVRLSNGMFVSDAYVKWRPGRPSLAWCTTVKGGAPPTRPRFIRWAARKAQAANHTYKVPVSVTVAQAILESGWGRSALTRQGGAFFGMKCFGTPGPIALGCRSYRTTECGSANCFRTSARFRTYSGASRSFLDHARQLATLERYRPAFRHVRDPDRFAIAVHRAGYATSPTYAKNLIKLMKQYNLYRFDPGAGVHGARFDHRRQASHYLGVRRAGPDGEDHRPAGQRDPLRLRPTRSHQQEDRRRGRRDDVPL
ncbi:sporangiospore maturation cell wall hydrolase GsmA [Luedemannella helvata]|uniref:Mannosyl-glycoprotein endo-beta-N-acetylglucosamidase-like domain-containing protein n=1 Tax=Luedemannella helvata TaxID=349315 RepID=A0ABN2KVB0_9ACTN